MYCEPGKASLVIMAKTVATPRGPSRVAVLERIMILKSAYTEPDEGHSRLQWDQASVNPNCKSRMLFYFIGDRCLFVIFRIVTTPPNFVSITRMRAFLNVQLTVPSILFGDDFWNSIDDFSYLRFVSF